MKNILYSYYIGGKMKQHYMILRTEIKCKECGEKIYLEYQIIEKEVRKKCPNCKKENLISVESHL
ncbi:hypothetical protein ACE4NI_001664 [Campylobacter jejuni]